MRLFGGDADTLLGECEGCGRVLKVPRVAATETPAGFTVARVGCPCGRVHTQILQAPPTVKARTVSSSVQPPPVAMGGVAGAQPAQPAAARNSTLIAIAIVAVLCGATFMLTRACVSQPPAGGSSAGTSVEYIPLLGHLFTGVKVYQGATHEYRFEVLGGSGDCARMPSGKGVNVKYADDTLGWLDRDYLTSGGFYVRANDPAASSFSWSELPGCD